MKDIEVMSEDGKTKTSFRKLLILKCKETFQLINAHEKTALEYLSEIESCKDQVNKFFQNLSRSLFVFYIIFIVKQELKKELQNKFDKNEKAQRKLSVGNCRFV